MNRSIRFKCFLYSVWACKYRIIAVLVLLTIGIFFAECQTYFQNIVIGVLASTIATLFWSVLESYKNCIKARSRITLHFRSLLNDVESYGLGTASLEAEKLIDYINKLDNYYIEICVLAEDLTYKHEFKALLVSLQNLINSLKEDDKPELIKANIDNIKAKLNLF